VKIVVHKIAAVAVAVIVVLVFAGLGVYYYDAYHKLDFQLEGAHLASASLTSIQTNFDIAVRNPGPLPIYIPNGDFDTYLNDAYIGKGSFGSITVSGNSQSRITVPVTVNTSDVPQAIFAIITGGGNVAVRIQGSANLVIFRVPFNATLYNAHFG
jgi:LEA14-like dessication related protein